MTPEKLLVKIGKILNNLKIPYVVTGGFAVSVWGRPRYTADIDIVIELISAKLDKLSRELLAVDKDVYVSKVAMKEALEREGEFNFIHPQTGLKVDFWVIKDKFEELKIKRGITKKFDGQKINFITPEDLILSKLSWYRESQSQKHLDDIKSVLRISRVDVNYIKNWAEKQATDKIFEEILRGQQSQNKIYE